MIKRGTCLFVLLLFLLPVIKSQQREPGNDVFFLSPNPARSSFFDHYISGIAIDKTGFLWIGSNKGLLRYDGTTLKKFVLDAPGRFSTSNDVLYLIQTKKEGTVFVRLKSGDLYKIKEGVPYLFDSSQRTNYYSYHVVGNFPSENALKAFNKSREELTGTLQWNLKEGNILSLDDNQFLAVDRKQSGLLLFSDTSASYQRIALPGQFESYIQLGSRFFILTGKLESYEFIPSTGKLVKTDNTISPPGSGISVQNTHFYCDFNSGRSFFLSGNRLYELSFNSTTNSIKTRFMTHTREMRQPFLQIIVDTATGAHFFPTKIGGFYTGEYTRLKNHLIPLALIRNYKDPSYIIPYAVQKLNDSSVVIPNGTFLTINSNGNSTQKIAPPGLNSNRYSIALLPGNDILCASPYGGLKRFSAQTGYRSGSSYTAIPFGETDDTPIGLMLPEGDSVWVCTHEGIYIVKPKVTTTVFRREKINHDGAFFEMRLFQREDENSILMSNQFGLFRLHTRKPFRIDTIQPGTLKYIRHVLRIDDKLLLCGYKTGLFIYKNGNYLPVPLYNRHNEVKLCHNSFLDDDGMLWVTTDKGLFKTTLTSLLNSIEPGGPPPLFFKYGGIHDRSENIEFNGGGHPSYALLRNNTLVYPAISGIVSFNYKKLNEQVHFGPHSFVYNLRTTINKSPVEVINDSIRLSSDAAQVYLDVDIPYFGSMENAILEYKYDSAWTEFPYGEGYEVVSVKVRAGYSHLWLRVRSGYGKDDYAVKKLIIYRAYKLSEKGWFYPALLALLLLIIWSIVRINASRIGKINRKLEYKIDKKTTELKSMVETKDLLLGIISHDMISPLRHIALLSNLVEKKEKLDTKEMRDTLSTIRHTCEKLHMEFTGVVSWIKYTRETVLLEKEEINLYEMVENSLNIYQSLETVHQVSLVNAIQKDMIVWIDPRLIAPIINNIISNALKNTYEGEIRISGFASAETGRTTMLFKDSGIGFKPAALERTRKILSGDYPASYANYGSGLGFFMIAELSRLHDAEVTIDSELDSGTTITLVF